MTLNTDLQTGDTTYKDRVDRYNHIMERLAQKPKPTLREIGEELGISKQNVSRLIKRGTVRPSGRPPTNEGRRKRLMARLTLWQSRRTTKLAEGKDVSFEDKWIADLEARLKQLA